MNAEIPPTMTIEVRHQQFIDELKTLGVLRDREVETAFRQVPRHCFLPNVALDRIFRNEFIPVGRLQGGRASSTASQPSFMAIMLQELAVKPGECVFEIGTATGFNAALLSQLLGPEGLLVTIEYDSELVTFATDNLIRFGYTAVPALLTSSDRPLRWLSKPGVAPIGLACGDAWDGVTLSRPFDRLIATIGSSDLSPAWLQQCSANSRLVIPMTLFPNVTLCITFDRNGDELVSRSIYPCKFVPAQGRMGERASDWSKLRIVARQSTSMDQRQPYGVIQTLETNLQISLLDQVETR